MSYRSLNGLNGSNLIITNNYVARLPIEQTQTTSLDPVIIGLKGITGFTGSAGNVLKSNSANNALEWATDNNEIITATLPLLKTGIDISLKGITGFTGAGKILKVNSNNDAFEWATDNNNVYTGTAPIIINSSTKNITYNNDTVATFNYKTFGNMTTFNNGLEVKYLLDNTNSGFVRFWDDNNSNYIDLHPCVGHQLPYTVNMFLPTPISNGDTVIVSRNSTDTLTNKTITSFIGVSSATITAPSNTGTLALANSTIAFGDDGLNPVVRSYIFDPRQNLGVPNSVYNVLSYHNNGTETAINNWSAGNGGLSSHISFNFGGAMKFRFHTDETIKVGSKSFLFPTNAGTLALVGETSNWTVSSNIISPASNAVDTLKMKNIQNPTYSGTKLIENNYNGANYGWSMYGTNPKFILGLGGTGNVSYPMLGNDSGGFLVHINNTGDCFKIDTSKNATFYGNRLDIGTHLRLETVSTNNHYLTDPNSTVGSSNNEYVLYYNTASTLSILNAGDPNNGEVRLSIGGSPMFSVDSGTCKVLTSEFQTPRFKIVSNGSETYINNPDPAANSSPFLTYHQNGTDLNFSTPVGGSANTSYIRHYIGSQLKLFIGGASTINYTPMVIEGSLTITNNGDLTMYNGDLIMTGGNIDITGNISGTTCEIDIDGGVNCLGGVSANALGCKVGFQDTLPGYGTNLYGVIVAEQTYGYFATNTIPGTGLGGTYDAYWGGGSIGGTSDIRMKKNINTIENPIDIIKRLRGVNFEWKCEGKPKGVQIGYIAQEVKEVIPSIVDFLPTTCEMCPDGTYGVAPMNISAVLVEGIKAQQLEIDTLKTELDTYKLLMDKLINSKTFADFKKNIA